MKIDNITITLDFEIPNVEVGDIRLDAQLQAYIYTAASEEEPVGIQVEITDYVNQTFRGLPIDDFKKTIESYKANGIDLHKAIETVTMKEFEKRFNKEAFIALYTLTNRQALEIPFKE